MGEIRILTEGDLRQLVGFGEPEFAAIEAVYPIVSAGQASMPPIMRIEVPERNGEIDIKSAYLPGYDGIAVKVSAGFFDNPKVGLPSLGGLMMVFDSSTGVPRSALFDNGYLTDLRTALAGAVAAQHLSQPSATVAAVFGAGVQARLQIEALRMVRDISEVFVWSRDFAKAERFAASTSSDMGIPVTATKDRTQAVATAHILVTTTPSPTPIVDTDMIHAGLHITAIGSDAESKQELSVEVIDQSDVFVCDSIAQSERLGELRSALDAGLDKGRATELGLVIDGTRPGRISDAQITVCDLTGTGAQDTAIATLAVQRATDRDAGTVITT